LFIYHIHRFIYRVVTVAPSTTPIITTTSAVTAIIPQQQKILIPLGEYLQNITKLLETVITQNASPDDATAFVAAGGIDRIVKLMALPNMPVEFAQSSICRTIANILRFIVVSI